MDDQQRLLEESLRIVKQQAFHLRKSLDAHRLMDALKFASTMLAELRSSALSPKNYYELYMAIFDELRHLTAYLYDAHMSHRHHLSDLYELVQYAGNIVPRLYLMITVGSVYMRVSKELLPNHKPITPLSKPEVVTEPIVGTQNTTNDSGTPALDDGEQLFPEQAVAENREKQSARNYEVEDVPPIKELMKDLLEMSRGVQHPTRGLFLRYYLSAMTRDYLPDLEEDGPHGTINDSIQFILQNFIEMNKLWVRLQHQGHTRDREKREVERKDLRLLVGSNLVRLSQLDGLDLEVYRNLVLPSVLDEIVSCRDIIAQEYLMEVIIQVFHDDFHLRSLDTFLQGTAHLQRAVNVKQIVISLIDRFAGYAARARDDEAAKRKDEKGKGKPISGIPDDVELFEVFWGQIADLVNARPEFTIQDVVALLNSLLNLSLNCYPDRLDHVDQVLGFAYDKVVEAKHANVAELTNSTTTSLQLQLLLNPIYAYASNILTILQFPSCSSTQSTGNYGRLLSIQPFSTRRQVAHTIARTTLKHHAAGFRVTTEEGVKALFGELCSVMIRDQPDGSVWGTSEEKVELEDMIEEQELVAKMVHLVSSDSFEREVLLLTTLREQIKEGGDVRIRFSVPPIVWTAIKVARKFKSEDVEKMFSFIRTTIQVLHFVEEWEKKKGVSQSGPPEIAFRLYLAAVQCADECGYEEIAYEFFVLALSTFEDSIAHSTAQIDALSLAVSTLYNSTVFGKDSYDALSAKCTVFAARMIKRQDQARQVAKVAHLFWVDVADEKKEEEAATTVPTDTTPIDANEEEKTEDENVVAAIEVDTERSKPPFRDSKKVLEMLQRAIKIADSERSRDVAVELFVEILENYVWYYERKNDQINSNYLNSLIALIKSTLSKLVEAPNEATVFGELQPDRKVIEATSIHFRNVLDYIKGKQEEEGGKWSLVEVY